MSWLRGFILIIFFIGLSLAVYINGPWVEKRLFPVLDAYLQVTDIDGRVEVYIAGRKLRSCQLQSADWAWRFGHNSILATSVSDEAGTPTEIARVLQIGDMFILGPYYVTIPTAVRTATNPQLSVTWYYSCHRLWLTEYDTVVPIAIKPPFAGTLNTTGPITLLGLNDA